VQQHSAATELQLSPPPRQGFADAVQHPSTEPTTLHWHGESIGCASTVAIAANAAMVRAASR
jgi:hypothetical protein